MVRQRKFQVLFFLFVFSTFLLHEHIPHNNEAMAIVWDGEEDSGEHHDEDEHYSDDDLHGIPPEDHQDVLPQDFLAGSGNQPVKKTGTDASSFLIAQTGEISPQQLLSYQSIVGSENISYQSLCKLTFSLRGPPLYS